jgi:hypothetical protein
MTYSLSHLLVGVMVAVVFLCSLSHSSAAVPPDASSGSEGGKQAEGSGEDRCVAFRVGGLMKAKSGAT